MTEMLNYASHVALRRSGSPCRRCACRRHLQRAEPGDTTALTLVADVGPAGLELRSHSQSESRVARMRLTSTMGWSIVQPVIARDSVSRRWQWRAGLPCWSRRSGGGVGLPFVEGLTLSDDRRVACPGALDEDSGFPRRRTNSAGGAVHPNCAGYCAARQRVDHGYGGGPRRGVGRIRSSGARATSCRDD